MLIRATLEASFWRRDCVEQCKSSDVHFLAKCWLLTDIQCSWNKTEEIVNNDRVNQKVSIHLTVSIHQLPSLKGTWYQRQDFSDAPVLRSDNENMRSLQFPN